MATTEDLDLLDRAARRYHDLDAGSWSDVRLVGYVADRVRLPRSEPADSFVLHAPLELLARAALLPWVAPEGRRAAQLRLLTLLDEFESWEPAEIAMPADRPVDATTAVADLVAALATGDLDAADHSATALACATSPGGLRSCIGDAVLPNLAAAAHAPIFLYHLPRAAPRGEATPELLRPLVRELARHPGLQIDWVSERHTTGGSPAALADALGAVPRLGVPASTFIFPLMHQVDSTGVARDLLGDAAAGVAPADAARVLLRAAARAMLLADPAHAPYGWSHCLTMPQAALGIADRLADPQLGVDVAGTFVVGFLAALASEPLPATVPPDLLEVDVPWSELVTRACVQRDAHLVKYTLACIDAAHADPGAARLFRAAAASLLSFWESLTPTA
jgi:hypothetical protein